MPEPTTFNPPDTGASKINWWYVGGGLVGVLGLMYLLSKNSSATGTTAAGTSINAALGSLEESALNVQGAQSKAQVGIDATNAGISTLEQGQTDIKSGIAGVSTQVAHNTDLLNQLFTAEQALSTALGTNSAAVQSVQTQIANLESEMSKDFSGLQTQTDQFLQLLQAKASNPSISFAPFVNQIIFSRGDNTRYLVSSATGLTELTYHQEMGLRQAGAQIMYIDSSLKQFKTGGVGDRG